MFKYYNPHPKGTLTDDCVKRAIVVVTGKDYMAVQRELNAYKKVTGAEKFNSVKNLSYVEEALKATKIILKEKMSAGEFCKKYPKGRYILDMDEHWSACIDGIIYDTWDCSKDTVNFAYMVEVPKGCPLPDLKKQVLRYCCTSEVVSKTEAVIRIYDGNGNFVERRIPPELTAGYVRCLQDQNYTYIEI